MEQGADATNNRKESIYEKSKEEKEKLTHLDFELNDVWIQRSQIRENFVCESFLLFKRSLATSGELRSVIVIHHVTPKTPSFYPLHNLRLLAVLPTLLSPNKQHAFYNLPLWSRPLILLP